MQLYTIQLPGTGIIRHGWLSCPNSIVCALPRYRGYLLKFASRPPVEPWIPWSGDWQAAPSEQPCANPKKNVNAHADILHPKRWIGAIECLFTYPARISPAFLPTGAHLLWFHADRLALTRIPFSAHSVCYHANLHFLQHVCPLVWNIMAIVSVYAATFFHGQKLSHIPTRFVLNHKRFKSC